MEDITEKNRPLSPITFRLTSEEKAKLEVAANGLTVSAYIRSRIFGGTIKPARVRGKVPVKDHQSLARLLGMLGQSRIANNLNQLAKMANTESLPLTPDVEADIREACTHIAQMRILLIKALGLQDGGKS